MCLSPHQNLCQHNFYSLSALKLNIRLDYCINILDFYSSIYCHTDHTNVLIINSVVCQISMSVLMIMLAVSKCVTTYRAHIIVAVMMVISWMEINATVSAIVQLPGKISSTTNLIVFEDFTTAKCLKSQQYRIL